jgi:hypothetical protein
VEDRLVLSEYVQEEQLSGLGTSTYAKKVFSVSGF